MLKVIPKEIPTSLYVHTIGFEVRVVCIVTSESEANEYMQANPATGVIAMFGPFIMIGEIEQAKQS